jgi:hypothetical protein
MRHEVLVGAELEIRIAKSRTGRGRWGDVGRSGVEVEQTEPVADKA